MLWITSAAFHVKSVEHSTMLLLVAGSVGPAGVRKEFKK